MVIRISKSKSSICKRWIMLVMLFDLQCLHLFDISALRQLNTTTNKILISFLTIILVGYIILCVGKRDTVYKYLHFYQGYFIYIFLWMVAISIYTMPKYNESIMDMYISLSHFILLGLVIPCVFIIDKEKNIHGLLGSLSAIVTLEAIIVIIGAVFYNIFGMKILSLGSEFFRTGRIRITLSEFTPYFIIYNFSLAISTDCGKKAKRVAIISVLLMLFALFYSDMSRIREIAIILSIAVVIYSSHKMSKLQFLLFVLGIMLFVGAIYTNALGGLFSSFSTEGTEGGSTRARLEAIEYFRQFTDENKLFGMGVVRPYNNYLTAIASGPLGNYHFDDIGIMGLYYHFGISGVVLYVVILVRFIYIAIRIKTADATTKNIINGSIVYLIITAVSLSAFDPQRIMALPILMSVFEYSYKMYGKSSSLSLHS